MVRNGFPCPGDGFAVKGELVGGDEADAWSSAGARKAQCKRNPEPLLWSLPPGDRFEHELSVRGVRLGRLRRAPTHTLHTAVTARSSKVPYVTKHMGCPTMLLLPFFFGVPLQVTTQPHNVVLIVLDGVRPTEVFTRAQPALMTSDEGGVEDPILCRARFGGATNEERREALMPFLWRTMARQGQVFGNAQLGSSMRVTNGRGFSYPGYNELLTRAHDPRIESNDHPVNSNVTVFEWLSTLKHLKGRVQAFATWDAFVRIFNVGRSMLDGTHLPSAVSRGCAVRQRDEPLLLLRIFEAKRRE